MAKQTFLLSKKSTPSLSTAPAASPKVFLSRTGSDNGSSPVTCLLSRTSMFTWSLVQDKYVHLEVQGIMVNFIRPPRFVNFSGNLNMTCIQFIPPSDHSGGHSHQTIVDTLHSALLTGANLEPHFWPYALYYFLRIKNAQPGKDDSPSYFKHFYVGLQADFTHLCTFGCRVWVAPPPPWTASQLIKRSLQVWHLPQFCSQRYTKNIPWFEPKTDQVNIASQPRLF